MPQTIDQIAFDLAPIGIVLTENRIIKSCNLSFAHMFGYAREDLIAQSFRMLYPSATEFDAIRDVGLKALSATGEYSDERIMHRRDGTPFWARVRVATPTPESPLSRAILSFADISGKRPEVELTPREKQVVMRLGQGRTSKEIARELGLSPRTIDDYRARLLRKFDVRNIAELLSRIMGVGG
ncbi:MAG TPA: PAS and helix-turn-helix domain-containing protein [Rhodobacteraceae bacterium]|nr:PAS and helix-turn-helix domain-containing protein [Paracoccaceae bacterium]